MKSRIVSMECTVSMTGEARIGRVAFSKSGRTLHYGEQELRRLHYPGHDDSNHEDVATGEHYRVSGPRKNGGHRRCSERVPVHVDADVREEYWSTIRGLPHRSADDACR